LKSFIFSKVLDVGTGSGILALVAAAFQAQSVMAIDNDPLAVEAAQTHIRLNNLESIVTVALASPENVIGPFSLILANLTLNDLIPLADAFKRLLVSKGILVVSGVLDSQAKSLISHFVRKRLAFLGSHLEEEWACILFQGTT
jgi:ribosomal protein L11 methyltransferase